MDGGGRVRFALLIIIYKHLCLDERIDEIDAGGLLFVDGCIDRYDTRCLFFFFFFFSSLHCLAGLVWLVWLASRNIVL